MKGYPDRKYIEWNEVRRKSRGKGNRIVICPHCGKNAFETPADGRTMTVQKYWRVKIKNCGDYGTISQHFNIKKFGGKRKAFEAAKEFRNIMLEAAGQLYRLEE